MEMATESERWKNHRTAVWLMFLALAFVVSVFIMERLFLPQPRHVRKAVVEETADLRDRLVTLQQEVRQLGRKLDRLQESVDN